MCCCWCHGRQTASAGCCRKSGCQSTCMRGHSSRHSRRCESAAAGVMASKQHEQDIVTNLAVSQPVCGPGITVQTAAGSVCAYGACLLRPANSMSRMSSQIWLGTYFVGGWGSSSNNSSGTCHVPVTVLLAWCHSSSTAQLCQAFHLAALGLLASSLPLSTASASSVLLYLGLPRAATRAYCSFWLMANQLVATTPPQAAHPPVPLLIYCCQHLPQ